MSQYCSKHFPYMKSLVLIIPGARYKGQEMGPQRSEITFSRVAGLLVDGVKVLI